MLPIIALILSLLWVGSAELDGTTSIHIWPYQYSEEALPIFHQWKFDSKI